MLNAFLDMIVPPRCAGCDRPGAVACHACLAELGHEPSPRAPGPAPRGLPECWSAARYDGTPRRLILAYKERGRTALAPPLAACLTTTLVAALGASEAVARLPGAWLALVPVPSSPRAVRQRGHDPVRRLAALAARRLRARGWPVTSAPVLRQRRKVRDQARLSASERAANLAEAFMVDRRPIVSAGRFWGRAGPLVVLVDDIVTTGATLAEASRALRVEGMRAHLAIALAATARRGRR